MVHGKDNSGSAVYTGLIATVAAVGGFLFGFDWAVISGAVPYLEQHFRLTPFQLGVAVSSALLGCIGGVCVAGVLSDRFGRKRLLIAAAVLYLFSALLTAVAGSLGVFIAARLLGGIAIGLSSPISPMYIAEISPARRRGALVTLNQLAITFGIVMAYLSDWWIAGLGSQQWGNEYAWRWMFASEAPPALLFLVALWFVPESPRWLAKQGLFERAEEILARVGGPRHAQTEIEEIRQILRMEEPSLRQLFRPGFRRALLIGVLVMIFSQITGNSAVFAYTPKLLLELGFEDQSTALLGMVMVGVVNFLVTVVAICVIDRIGRRPLLMIAPAGMAICMALVACQFYLDVFSPWVLLVLILGFVSCYAIGIGPGSWLIISEIFPTHVRGRAMAICTLSLWIANFVTTLVFPIIWAFSASGTFWLFAATSAAAAIFAWAAIPETKRRTLEEIERSWFTAS